MEDRQSAPKRRVSRRSLKNLMPLIIIVLVLLFASLYFLFPQNDSDKKSASNGIVEPTPSISEQDLTDQQSPPSEESLDAFGNIIPAEKNAPTTETAQPAGPGAAQGASADVSPDPLCQENADNVDSFFQLLDNRDYIQAFNLGVKSTIYFPALIQRLADNPPIVTGETNDLFTILQNTAHFFRIIGKKNIIVLKGILDREKSTFEQALADFYELTQQPQCLEERFNLNVPPDSLYLYSGFFLNTMGGRLYLFRRDSMSRMVVNFYAILIVENANRQGRNQYGIEIKSSIDSLIDEIESSKIDLKMREYYLDTLYDMKEKYQ